VLAGRLDLSPRLAHHLALLIHRSALLLEDTNRPETADPYWRLAWPCWLAVLAPRTGPDALESEARTTLLGWLLDVHLERIKNLLGRAAVDQARRHWRYIHGLPALAQNHEPLRRELEESVEHFRERLATEYLVLTREAMHTGAAAPGYQADYAKGLAYLTRLLSLDRENLRLLTALVEICAEWFLECYNNNDLGALCQGVERFTPFALQLARLLERDGGAGLTARAALAEFYRFRGFAAANPAHRAALYREAERFHPSNENP
jgi:hypothetical protein